jgi:hypothetical protein
MQWNIKPELYSPWKNFLIEIKECITLETGNSYQLKGNNGAGKTTFIKKVLIPYLQQHPYLQYILYIEQQVQCQLDSVRAYSAVNKPHTKINDIHDMIAYQIKLLYELQKFEPRPLVIILDEPSDTSYIAKWLLSLSWDSVCLIYVSHSDLLCELKLNASIINFELRDNNRTLVTIHEDNI